MSRNKSSRKRKTTTGREVVKEVTKKGEYMA
jgi:hypothetical protein